MTLWQGNDHTAVGNTFHHLVRQCSDCGAFYAGRDWTYRGNELLNNTWHSINPSIFSSNVMTIYLDDQVCLQLPCTLHTNMLVQTRNASAAIVPHILRILLCLDSELHSCHLCESLTTRSIIPVMRCSLGVVSGYGVAVCSACLVGIRKTDVYWLTDDTILSVHQPPLSGRHNEFTHNTLNGSTGIAFDNRGGGGSGCAKPGHMPYVQGR